MKQPQKRLRCENQQVRVVSVCVQMEQHPLPPLPAAGRPVRVVASVDVAVASMCYFYAQAKNKSSRSSSEEKSKCKAKAAAHLNICRVTIIFISHAAQPALPPAC